MKPFHLDPKTKRKFITDKLNYLTEFHRGRCNFYDQYLAALGIPNEPVGVLENIPFLPARMFKEFSLKSTDTTVAIANSSGTTGNVSEINLSYKTMLAQGAALNKILKSHIGPVKQPMLIVGSKPQRLNKFHFNARGAAYMGFINFADPLFYSNEEDHSVSFENIENFLCASDRKKNGIVFGFTADIWNFLNKLDRSIGLNFGSHISLVHGGGWKKLTALGITDEDLKYIIFEKLGIVDVSNYYGMIEQAGSIFFQCKSGKMHASMFSDVLVRDTNSLDILPPGEHGIIQVLSTLPESYPGHSLLTEDIGYIHEDKKCECGRYGTSVVILGRLTGAEIRGCSDAYGAR